MLDTSSDVVGASVRIGSGEVHVKGASRAVVGVEWMHGCDLTGVRIHASCRLTRLDVAPDCLELVRLTHQYRVPALTHGCHVSLVVHEASIEVGRIVSRWAGDESASTAEWILKEVEHGEELDLVNNNLIHERQIRLTLPGGIIMWSPNQPAMTE
jgi:hypothetical protein